MYPKFGNVRRIRTRSSGRRQLTRSKKWEKMKITKRKRLMKRVAF